MGGYANRRRRAAAVSSAWRGQFGSGPGNRLVETTTSASIDRDRRLVMSRPRLTTNPAGEPSAALIPAAIARSGDGIGALNAVSSTIPSRLAHGVAAWRASPALRDSPECRRREGPRQRSQARQHRGALRRWIARWEGPRAVDDPRMTMSLPGCAHCRQAQTGEVTQLISSRSNARCHWSSERSSNRRARARS